MIFHRLGTRSARHDIATIPAVLKSDWIKLSSVRSNLAILAINVGAGFLVAWAVATLVTDEVLFVAEVGLYWSVVTAVLAAIAGILLFTSEAQHGTLGQPPAWAGRSDHSSARPARTAIPGSIRHMCCPGHSARTQVPTGPYGAFA